MPGEPELAGPAIGSEAVGHPIPVEPEGDPLGKVNDRLRLSSEIGRVEHEEVTGVPICVVDEGQDPPILSLIHI